MFTTSSVMRESHRGAWCHGNDNLPITPVLGAFYLIRSDAFFFTMKQDAVLIPTGPCSENGEILVTFTSQ